MRQYSWIRMPEDTEKLARMMKVLGDANRLGIILTIGRDARSVSEIINATGLSQTLVSFHLRILREKGLVTTERSGPFIYYALSDPALLDALVELSKRVDSKVLGLREMKPAAHRRALEKRTRK